MIIKFQDGQFYPDFSIRASLILEGWEFWGEERADGICAFPLVLLYFQKKEKLWAGIQVKVEPK